MATVSLCPSRELAVTSERRGTMDGRKGWAAESANRVSTPSVRMTAASDQKFSAPVSRSTGIDPRAIARPTLVMTSVR